MKLNKIIALCKKSKMIMIYSRRAGHKTVEQWIGDGASCYRCDGLPILHADSAAALFDIPRKDVEKWKITELELPESYDFTDSADKGGETAFFEADPIYIQYGGATMKPLRSPGDLPLFIDIRYLSPFLNDMDCMYLYRRTTESGQDYVAVKVGMILAGIIMPRKLELEELARNMRAIAEDVERAVESEGDDAG